MFVFVVFKGVSTIGGVGGGAIAIPLLMFFFGLTLKPATAISSFAIMLETSTKFLTSVNERNPDKPQSCSRDYQITNVMMPLTLVGSFVGAYIYVSFPELVLEIMLTFILLLLSIQSFYKAM